MDINLKLQNPKKHWRESFTQAKVYKIVCTNHLLISGHDGGELVSMVIPFSNIKEIEIINDGGAHVCKNIFKLNEERLKQ